MSLTRKIKKSKTPAAVKEQFNIIITPEKAGEWDKFTETNMPPAYSRMFVNFLMSCPKEKVKPKS